MKSLSWPGISRLSSGGVNLRCPGGTKVFTEVAIQWKMRKDRVTVTNPLLRLLGIVLVSQLSVHIPDTENREEKIRFGQYQPGCE